MNAFSVLGLPMKFDLSPSAVTAAYLSRARLAHPDADDDASPGGLPLDDADIPSGASSPSIERLNQAKAVLLDDEQRANLVLELLGGPSASADRSLPPALLGEVLEQRSKLAEATAAGDGSAIAELRAWAAAKRAEHLASVAAIFQTISQSPNQPQHQPQNQPQPDLLRKARTELNALRYIERMLEQTA